MTQAPVCFTCSGEGGRFDPSTLSEKRCATCRGSGRYDPNGIDRGTDAVSAQQRAILSQLRRSSRGGHYF